MKIKGKGKIVSVLKQDAMKEYGGVELYLQIFFYLGTSWRWVASFTPRPLYPHPGNGPLYPLDRRLGGNQSRSNDVKKKKILTLPGHELRRLGRPARGRVDTLTTLSRLMIKIKFIAKIFITVLLSNCY
jgi:hypothetical protein